MLSWLAYQVPWWVWAVLAVCALGAVGFFWRNVKVLLAAAALIAAFVYTHRQRQKGYNDRVDEEKEATDALDKAYEEIENRPARDRDAVYDSLLARAKNKR